MGSDEKKETNCEILKEHSTNILRKLLKSNFIVSPNQLLLPRVRRIRTENRGLWEITLQLEPGRL